MLDLYRSKGKKTQLKWKTINRHLFFITSFFFTLKNRGFLMAVSHFTLLPLYSRFSCILSTIIQRIEVMTHFRAKSSTQMYFRYILRCKSSIGSNCQEPIIEMNEKREILYRIDYTLQYNLYGVRGC